MKCPPEVFEHAINDCVIFLVAVGRVDNNLKMPKAVEASCIELCYVFAAFDALIKILAVDLA